MKSILIITLMALLLAACDNRSSYEKLADEVDAYRKTVALEATSDWAEKGFSSQEVAIDAYLDAKKAEQVRLAQEKEAAEKAKALYDAQVAQSLVSPEWVPTENFPDEWRKIRALDGTCNFGGQEQSSIFQFQDPRKNILYSFQRIKAPPGVGWPDESEVTLFSHKVWVSSLNPNLFLSLVDSAYLNDGSGFFSIHMVRDGAIYGQHKMLDGKPHGFSMQEFKEVDYSRWSVDVDQQKPWGDEETAGLVCDEIKYAHWLDYKWTVKGGGATKTLRELMNQL